MPPHRTFHVVAAVQERLRLLLGTVIIGGLRPRAEDALAKTAVHVTLRFPQPLLQAQRRRAVSSVHRGYIVLHPQMFMCVSGAHPGGGHYHVPQIIGVLRSRQVRQVVPTGRQEVGVHLLHEPAAYELYRRLEDVVEGFHLVGP